MIRQGIDVRASADGLRFNLFGLYLVNHDEAGNRLFAKSIEWEPEPEGFYRDPTLRLFPERAQVLMDDLWAAGLRPTAGHQSEGVTAAQARHLEDMRAIAFARLNIEKPQ